MYPYDSNNKKNARILRREMTPEERHLWYDFLRRLPVNVKRQAMIEGYIVDFYIPSVKLVIEIDGRQHTLPEHREADEIRDRALSEWGIAVVRYRNSQVNASFNAVCNDLLKRLSLTASNLKHLS